MLVVIVSVKFARALSCRPTATISPDAINSTPIKQNTAEKDPIQKNEKNGHSMILKFEATAVAEIRTTLIASLITVLKKIITQKKATAHPTRSHPPIW